MCWGGGEEEQCAIMQKKGKKSDVEESLARVELKLKATVVDFWLAAFSFLNNFSLPELIIAFLVFLEKRVPRSKGGLS